jgi:DNA-directed RNA polymerase sigma subunit (sigma70/sigma32)
MMPGYYLRTGTKESKMAKGYGVPTAASGRGERVLAPLAAYFRDITESPCFNAEEEKDLASRIEEGDGAARDQIVRTYAWS